jgi:hypothetical protein
LFKGRLSQQNLYRKKEAAETVHWLGVFHKAGYGSSELDILRDEAQVFVMILQKIINTLQKGKG